MTSTHVDLGNDEEGESMLEEEAICLSLTPQLHAMMLSKRRRSSCCPQLFERASNRWWNPRFDSDILEQQYVESSLPKLTIRFRYALSYAFLSNFVWSVYWVSTDADLWSTCIIASVSVAFLLLMLIVYSHHKHYQRHQFLLSCMASLILMCASLLPFGIYVSKAYRSIISRTTLFVDLSAPSIFTFYIEVLLLVYTILPLPMYLAITLCSFYSIVFEMLNIILLKDSQTLMIFLRLLLHVSIHLIGSHIMIMNEVRMRGTFMSVGQSLLVRRQFEIEKALKEKMILSVMPPKVANWLMEKAHSEDVDDYTTFSDEGPILRKVSSPRPSNAGGDQPIQGENFRPFNMNLMDDVSILFADIVGFTRMSSNKTAEHLVGLLNDLFGRFDELCVQNNCEKINTLGDCYYAVSGCPEPRADHAECCVNMGLAMIKAIKQFDADTNEDVNMRVGVHTGKVLCGIVGTMRFKFDVWSQDVTFANQMESTGKPGQVHITDVTYQFLPPNTYVIEDGPNIQGPGSEGKAAKDHKTYFITRRIDAKDEEEENPYDDDTHQFLPTVASDLNDTDRSQMSGSSGELKSSSLPNMIDCLVESDTKGKIVSRAGGEPLVGSPDVRYTSANNRDLLRIKLPRFTRTSDKVKVKTTSLPKISNNKGDANSQKLDLVDVPDSVNGGTGTPKTKSLVPSPVFLTASSSPPSPSPAAPPPTPKNPDDVEITFAGLKDPRKDSGIRSRRSSIQEQIFAMNGLNTGDLLINHVSDYFTTSHSSVSDSKIDSERSEPVTKPHPGLSTLNECEKKFLQMRKQSDLQMIKCVQQERKSYIMVSPLSPITLFFVDTELEKQYRERAHQPRKEEERTLASTLYNTYFDILITLLVYLSINISLLLLYSYSNVWVILFTLSTCWHLFILLLCLYKVINFSRKEEDRSLIGKVYKKLTRWKAWHACGASLLCLPMIIVFSNFSCDSVIEGDFSIRYFCYIVAVSLIHFCNFTQLNCWMKNVLASLSTIIFLSLVGPPVCRCPFVSRNLSQSDHNFHESPLFNLTFLWNVNTTAFESDDSSVDISDHWFHVEVIISFLMLLLLVWLLNREFEISYRLSFYGYIMAVKDKINVQNMKNQAEWLLHNIIPQHVTNIIKTTAKYSKNHKNVGVMFASIINFNELYNEDYSSGKEYLRFLNELVADFDELLTKDQFKNIEKIKTIGATYMAASGLNPQIRLANAHQNQHICDLVDFAREMFRVIENFNQNMIGFKFILRIGLNCGDVTAGVIGTTKLFYDIWGDTVNIASRMDSTGVPNRIQITEECANILRPLYSVEHRGSVYVKGKDHMNVFLISFETSVKDEKER